MSKIMPDFGTFKGKKIVEVGPGYFKLEDGTYINAYSHAKIAKKWILRE